MTGIDPALHPAQFSLTLLAMIVATIVAMTTTT